MNSRTLDERMDADLKEVERRREPPPTVNSYRKCLLRRALLMVVAFIIYTVVEIVAKITLVIHWIYAMARGRPSLRLQAVCSHLSAVISLLWGYLLFCHEEPPWPLDRWAQWQNA